MHAFQHLIQKVRQREGEGTERREREKREGEKKEERKQGREEGREKPVLECFPWEGGNGVNQYLHEDSSLETLFLNINIMRGTKERRREGEETRGKEEKREGKAAGERGSVRGRREKGEVHTFVIQYFPKRMKQGQ